MANVIAGVMGAIIGLLNDATDLFYEIYIETWDWYSPFNAIAQPFLTIAYVFNDLAWGFYDFSEWLIDVAHNVSNFLTWETAVEWVRDRIDDLEALWTWFIDWVDQVAGLISDWWDVTQETVKGWIDAAIAGLGDLGEDWLNFWNNLWPSMVNLVDTLQANVDDIVDNLLTNYVNLSFLSSWWDSRLQDIQGLIDSALAGYNDILASWTELRDQVVEFFTDPWSWLYDRFDDFIERFW